jgi:hypothetical protein
VSAATGAAWIAATGTAELRVPPDRATAHVALRATSAHGLQAAAREVAPRERAVLAALDAAGVPASLIATLRYDTGREQRHVKGQWVAGDYYVDHVLSVEVTDIARVGAIVAAARQAGATRIAGVHFWLAEDEAHRERAHAAAVAQAFARARTLAQAAGVRLGRVVRLGTPEALAATLGARAEEMGGHHYAMSSAGGPPGYASEDDDDAEPLILPVPIVVGAVVHGAWTVD